MGFVTTVYADPGTFTGADSNANVDADDEVAFMAKDVGARGARRRGATRPAWSAGSGVKVKVRSTLGGSATDGWIYLFKRSGNLSPGAGKSYVDYDFQLLSGAYKTTYKLQDGPNPENTTVTTPYYVDHFSDRWLNDQIKRARPATPPRSTSSTAPRRCSGPGNCGRSEDTFDDAEGAFIANKVGPVRAIRSYIGANSGPLTQREHIFYEQREDIRTFLRVHAIPGPWDFFDYSAAASGMTYRNNLNTGGVTIDGIPGLAHRRRADLGVGGRPAGRAVDGALDWSPTSPASTAPRTTSTTARPGPGAETQCTGDAQAFGESGPWLNSDLPNTDPRTTPFNSLASTRTIYFEAPGKANGAARAAQAGSPFQITSRPLAASGRLAGRARML